jgi:hypothetical protein
MSTFKEKRQNLDILDVEVEGINTSDYPDFCDAYITKAAWSDGTELTEDELDELNNDSDFVYRSVLNYIN